MSKAPSTLTLEDLVYELLRKEQTSVTLNEWCDRASYGRGKVDSIIDRFIAEGKVTKYGHKARPKFRRVDATDLTPSSPSMVAGKRSAGRNASVQAPARATQVRQPATSIAAKVRAARARPTYVSACDLKEEAEQVSLPGIEPTVKPSTMVSAKIPVMCSAEQFLLIVELAGLPMTTKAQVIEGPKATVPVEPSAPHVPVEEAT